MEPRSFGTCRNTNTCMSEKESQRKYRATQKYRDGCARRAARRTEADKAVAALKRKEPQAKARQSVNNARWYATPHGRAKSLWHAAKRRADAKGIAFSLTTEWVLSRLKTGRCEVTDLPFEMQTIGTGMAANAPFSPSIDRIDSLKGYEPDNCRVVIWALNVALGQWGEKVFSVVAKAYISWEWLR